MTVIFVCCCVMTVMFVCVGHLCRGWPGIGWRSGYMWPLPDAPSRFTRSSWRPVLPFGGAHILCLYQSFYLYSSLFVDLWLFGIFLHCRFDSFSDRVCIFCTFSLFPMKCLVLGSGCFPKYMRRGWFHVDIPRGGSSFYDLQNVFWMKWTFSTKQSQNMKKL